MCALSPLFPVCEWPLDLDAPISHDPISYGFADTESFDDDFLHFPPTDLPQIQLDRFLLSAGDSGGGDNPTTTIVKKLNHNASERDRRRKINSLYSSLRSLLPPSEQTKRLSIPATVSRILKYIPELQTQVEILVQKKEQILSRICRQDKIQILSRICRQDKILGHQRNKRKLDSFKTSPLNISVTQASETEVMTQISKFEASQSQTPLSAILLNLEEDGLYLTDASCFESFGGIVFYNLNFQVERTYNLEAVVLIEKILSLYEKKTA